MLSGRILVAGLPGAGKSSFADAVEESDLGLVHVPMDRYIKPIPDGMSFLDWVKGPSCVDWSLVLEHLGILDSGRVCFTPRPDWSARGQWVSPGGALTHGPGRRMRPSRNGYLVAGTHAFSLAGKIGPHVKVFVDTSDAEIASRLEGRPIPDAQKARVLRRHLRENLAPLRGLRDTAELVIDGSWPHDAQVCALREYLGRNK